MNNETKKFDCIPSMSLEDAIKMIPGGARIDLEECFVESLTWNSNEESMHEHWGDDVTPAEAVLKLYERVRWSERTYAN